MTVLTWISEAADMGPSIKLCPITVADPSDEGMTLDEADLCKDEVGTPMRLSVGQVARMVFLDEDSASTKFGEASVADPSIVDFQFEMGARAGTVTGFRTGSTSLTLLALHAETARNCEIVVE